MSKFSDEPSTNSRLTQSVKCEFTFQTQSDQDEFDTKTQSEEPNQALQKFLTDSSETTSMQEGLRDKNSMMPKYSEDPNRDAKPASLKDDITLSNLDSKYDNSIDEDNDFVPNGLLIKDQKNLNEVVQNVSKRISKIHFPGVRIGRLSKDDFETEYQRGILAEIKVIIQ